jgi:plasmid rolling circle replication initiator protein Rep
MNNVTQSYARVNPTDLEILQDLKKNGKPRPWRPKKIRNLKVADSFDRLGQKKKAERVRGCATFLEFTEIISTGERFLSDANFCRERLCPMCQWRKSLRVIYEVSRVMDAVETERPDLAPIFLTLTLKSCSGGELPSVLDAIFKSWDIFLHDRTIKSRVKGWFRELEITYNRDEDTHHPHIHAIIFVDKSYFRSRDYLCQKCWVWLWRKALRIDYNPIVDVRRIRNLKNRRKSVLEVAKYTLKDTEFVTEDEALTDKLVSVYSKALKGRRLYAYGGILKEIAQNLFAKTDPEQGDLTHISDDTIRSDLAKIVRTSFWHSGIANYVRRKR